MTRRKVLAWSLRVIAALATIGTPLVVILQKFPLWRAQGGRWGAIGSGTIILAIIVFATFKKYITAFAAEKFGAMSAGVSLLFLWVGAAILCYVLESITSILQDLTTVFIFSAIGVLIGVSLAVIARKIDRKTEVSNEKDR